VILSGEGNGLSFSKMYKIVEADQDRCGGNARYLAFVVNSFIAQGMASMFAGLQSNKDYNIRIFHDKEQALKWLNTIILRDKARSPEDGNN
jgi:hypothetical protein